MGNNYFDNQNRAQWDNTPVLPATSNRGAVLFPCPPKKRSHTRFVIAALIVLVVALSTVLALILLGGDEDSSISFGNGSSSEEGGDFGSYYDYFDDDSDTTLTETTIAAGPTTDSLSLTISEPTQELTLQEIYQKVIPSIVSITALNGDTGGQGTGIIISEDGYIITNHHVITGEATASVTLNDGTVYDATLVGSDAESDLAVLKIDATGLTPAEFGNSDLLQVGDTALAISNPLGADFFGSMTEGIISSINREVNMDGYTMSLIQHTAAINSGSSGGALVNIYGQVVGITNMKMSSSYNSVEGLGFAIPSVWVQDVVNILLQNGAIVGRPTIGITCYELDAETAAANGLVAGIYVDSVKEGSDASAKGIQAGDILVSVNGVESLTMELLTALRDELGIGGIMNATVWRDGSYLDISFALVDQCELD